MTARGSGSAVPHPPGVAEWLAVNPGAWAGYAAGWWWCRYPVARGRTISAEPCARDQALAVLKQLREDARLFVQQEAGRRVTSLPDGSWASSHRGARVAAVGMVRLRELMDGAEPTKAETDLAGTVTS